MSATQYQNTEEVIRDWEDVEAMKRDHTMIVLMAIPDRIEGLFSVTFISREDRELPPWIIDRKAA